jgi:acetolactate synthase I/II/III large subunit
LLNKITVAEYIANFVSEQLEVDTLFTVTGGGAMFLNDSFGNHSKLRAIYNHHEQASTMAAVGYAKAKNSFGVACVTTGCGCTNAMTGLLDAWQDNAMLFVISGNVKVSNTSKVASVPLRQFGVQEANIIPIVDSITKYSVMVEDPAEIRHELEKSAFIAKNGRPGPVWIDVPQNIQGALVDPVELRKFVPDDIQINRTAKSDLIDVQLRLKESKRPIVVAGNGIRLSHMGESFIKFVETHQLPVVFSFLSIDLLPSNHNLAVGRLGAKGDRAGNFAVQNSDCILVLGCRLSVALTGFEYDLFGREADIIVVDIDELEHKKNTVSINKFLKMDLREFFSKQRIKVNHDASWNNKCLLWRNKWPVYQERYRDSPLVNMYECIKCLSENLPDNSHVVSDAGSAYYVTSQALQIKQSIKYHTSGAQADMGFSLPAAIGVSYANNGAPVVGITGDGSFQMNIQELQVLWENKPNVKIIIFNNDGYLSIKTTQKKFFNERYVGTGRGYGLSNPDFEKVVKAYGINYLKAASPSELYQKMGTLFSDNKPCIFEVICPEWQEVIPNVSALKKEDGSMISKPIEDMYPFLERDEFYSQMIVAPIPE